MIGAWFLCLLLLLGLLVGLKVFNKIDWPWILILAPLWIPGIVFSSIFVLMYLAFMGDSP